MEFNFLIFLVLHFRFQRSFCSGSELNRVSFVWGAVDGEIDSHGNTVLSLKKRKKSRVSTLGLTRIQGTRRNQTLTRVGKGHRFVAGSNGQRLGSQTPRFCSNTGGKCHTS